MQTNKMTRGQIGRLGEEMVRTYINNELIPSLKETEGWTDIIYTMAWFKAIYSQGFENFIKFEEEKQTRLILSNGFYPTKNFADYFNKLIDALSNTPDGFLIKMKRTGTFRATKEAIKEYNLISTITLEDMQGNQLLQSPSEDKLLPVVDGKIDVVEVKTNSGNQLQVNSYRNVVSNGYPLRLFKVELKDTSIMEKVIDDQKDVVTNCFKDMSTFTKRR